MANVVIIVGRTVRDIELRYTQGGLAVGNMTLAVDREMNKAKKQEAEDKGDPTADFLKVIMFGKTAEFVANNLGKGKKVFVQGRIQTSNYLNKEGVKVYTTDIIADKVEILEWENSNSNNGFGGVEGFSPTDSDSIPF